MSAGNSLKKVGGSASFDTLSLGRVLPQAIELEEAVLGAIMINKDAMASVVEILRAESFYKDAHRLIFEIMSDLFERQLPIDILTVHEGLKKAEYIESIGGPVYLTELTNKVSSAANVEYHARIVSQKHIQRELIRLSTEIIKDSFEDTKDIFTLLDDAEKHLYDITDKNLNTGYESLQALAVKAKNHIEIVSQQEEGLTGISTGFDELDKMTSGWQPSDLVIIAARPGMGKTAFTLSLARNASKYEKPVAIFSLEMAKLQLVQRLISMEAEIDNKSLRNGDLSEDEWKRLYTAVEKLADAPIYIDDTPAINIFELRAKCRRLKQNHDIEMIIIDYLQLMSSAPGHNRGNREQEISSISRALKGLAKELNVPVLALSQLSRAVETRGGAKRPMLSDLRESGAIEQDADLVTFIYRPDYYEIEDPDVPKGAAEIIIAKHRNGSTGTVNLKFIGQYVKFVNMDTGGFGDFGLGGDDPFFSSDIITRPSKLNDDSEFSDDSSMPF
jgi:replicative DNA helicase